MKHQGWYEDAGHDGNPPNDIQLFYVRVPDHGHEDPEVPDRANEQEAGEEVVIGLSSAREHEVQDRAGEKKSKA
jgi:hypothetical protein